jgi:hypothetical protein
MSRSAIMRRVLNSALLLDLGLIFLRLFFLLLL